MRTHWNLINQRKLPWRLASCIASNCNSVSRRFLESSFEYLSRKIDLGDLRRQGLQGQLTSPHTCAQLRTVQLVTYDVLSWWMRMGDKPCRWLTQTSWVWNPTSLVLETCYPDLWKRPQLEAESEILKAISNARTHTVSRLWFLCSQNQQYNKYSTFHML